MLHPGSRHRAPEELHANPQSQSQARCDLLRQHQQSGLLLWHLLRNIANHMRNHPCRCIRALKLNLHTKRGDQHLVHRRDRQIPQVFRPMPAAALHLSQGFRFLIKLHHQDLLLRYSFSVNINSFRRLYKLQTLIRGLTPFQVPL